jgi:hypothetical protein
MPDSGVALNDADLEEVKLRFPDEEKIIGVAPDEEKAEVKLELLDSDRYRVWKSGLEGPELLLGGPNGPMSAVLKHTTDGPEMTVWVEALPPSNAVAELAPPAARLILRALDVGERPTSTDDTMTLVAFEPLIKELSFGATDVNQIYDVYRDEKDPVLGVQTKYEAPQWQDADLSGEPDFLPYPAAYRRESTMLLTAQFNWTIANLGTDLHVKGEGPGAYDFYAILDDNDPHRALSLAGSTLTLTDAADSAFTDTIEHFDTFNVKWSISMDNGQGWSAVGVTRNQVYTLLDTPTTTLYHTVAHLATAPPAAGLSDPAAVVGAIWTQFADRDVRRVTDGHQLTYWENDQANATSTGDLLADGNGQCGSWAEFFRDTVRAHGISAQKIGVISTYGSASGLLVKNWDFVGAGTSGNATFPYAPGEFIDQAGVAGQGNVNPPGAFGNHTDHT